MAQAKTPISQPGDDAKNGALARAEPTATTAGPGRAAMAAAFAVVSVFLGADLTYETWAEPSAAGWILAAATVVAVALAFASLFSTRAFGVVALGVVWCAAATTWLAWPTYDRGGALALALGDDARTAFVLSMVFCLLPLGVALVRLRLWVVGLVPLVLWSCLPLVAGVVRDEPFEDFPLFRAFWGDLPSAVQPASVLVLVVLPLTLLAVSVSSLRRSGAWRDRVAETVGWVLLTATTLVLCTVVVRGAHVPTPLQALFPPAEGVGEAVVTLQDGSKVRVTTAGLDELSAAERARRPAWRLQVRGLRDSDGGGRTRLWINVLDARGRNILDRRREDFEIFESGARRANVDFTAHPKEGPPSFAPPHIWIANSAEGTVSKLSTRSGRREGDYQVGSDPSRTSVDLEGNVYVAGRASNTLSKVLASGCTGQACVGWTRDTCQGPRGLAVARDNSVWVGGNLDARGCLQRWTPEGELVFATELSSRVYGLALDQRGHLWAVLDHEGLLLRFRSDGRLMDRYAAPAPHSLYGIAIDRFGVVWLGNNESLGVWRFDPSDEEWTHLVSEAHPEAKSRGVAADAAGNVWVANSNLGIVSRFDAAGARWVADHGSGGVHPVGVAIDGDQFVWVINQTSHTASRLDPDGGDIVGTYPTGRGPYTYSDMTGYALHNFVAQSGTYQMAWLRTPLSARIEAPRRDHRIAAAGGPPVVLVPHIETYDVADPISVVEWQIDGKVVDTVRAPPWRGTWRYESVAVGPHRVTLRVVTAAGFTSEDTTVVQAVETFGTLRVQARRKGEILSSIPRTIEFVVDSSGSMWGTLPESLDGRRERKIDAAKRVLGELFAGLPADTEVGLRAYGHRTGRCDDTELLVPVGAADPAELSARVRALRPKGRTPIAASLRSAGDDLKSVAGHGYLGERMIVLVTDGIETCKGDPCAEAARLGDSLRLRSHVVGFGLSSKGESQTLRCIADAAGGTYADADGADELRRVLEEAIQVRFVVVDTGDGRVVHRGGLGAGPVLLPVGTYTVRFGSAESTAGLVSSPFVVSDGAGVAVTLDLLEDGPPRVVVLHGQTDEKPSKP